MHKLASVIAISIVASSFSQAASADRIFGVYAGVGQWAQNYDGSIKDLDSNGSAGEEIDFNNDLGLDDEDGNVIYVALEHPLPFLPNIKFQNTEMEISAASTINRNFSYGGVDYTASENVTTDADLTHQDLTMYYQVLDNWVSLDLGLTVRLFDGYVEINGSTNGKAREDFDSPVPLLYAKARFDLPFSGLSASIAANALGDGDNMFVDFEAALQYEHALGAGIELGFRRMDLDLDDIDDIEVDLTIDGAFFGLFYHL